MWKVGLFFTIWNSLNVVIYHVLLVYVISLPIAIIGWVGLYASWRAGQL